MRWEQPAWLQWAQVSLLVLSSVSVRSLGGPQHHLRRLDCKGASIIRDVLQFNFTGGVNGAFNAGLAKGFATVTQVLDFVASAAINKLGFACP